MVDHLHRLLRIMDAAGVDKACVNCIFHGDARRGNDIVARAVDRHPERFIPVAFVTPHYPEEAILELERCFDQIGAKFLKIYPSYAQRPIDDGAWAPIFDWCDSRGAAVMSHASFSHGNQPKGYRKLSDRYPNVKWVAAHAAGGTDRHWGAVEATRTCPNVYVETATDDSYFGRFERVVGGRRPRSHRLRLRHAAFRRPAGGRQSCDGRHLRRRQAEDTGPERHQAPGSGPVGRM